MKSFKDEKGRAWDVAINVTTVKRVRDLCTVDLMDLADEKANLMARLLGDFVLLGDVLYAVCKAQADRDKITDVDFGEALAGDALDRASTALLEGLVDFFPGEKRRLLARLLEKMKSFQGVAIEMAATKLDDPALDQRIRAAMQAELDSAMSPKVPQPLPGPSSGNAPESSA